MNELIILDYKRVPSYHIYNYGYCCSFVSIFRDETCVSDSWCMVVSVAEFYLCFPSSSSSSSSFVLIFFCFTHQASFLVSSFESVEAIKQYEPIDMHLHTYSHSNHCSDASDILFRARF